MTTKKRKAKGNRKDANDNANTIDYNTTTITSLHTILHLLVNKNKVEINGPIVGAQVYKMK